MASFIDCVIDQLQKKGVPPQEIKDLQDLGDDLFRNEKLKGKSDLEAQEIADRQLIEYAENFDRNLLRQMQQVIAEADIDKHMARYVDQEGLGAQQFMQQIKNRSFAVLNEQLGALAPVIDQLAPKMFKGIKTKLDAAEKIFTIIDGDVSSDLARVVNTINASLRERLMAAGGEIAEGKKPFVPFMYRREAILQKYKGVDEIVAKRDFAEKVYERLDSELSFKGIERDEAIQVIEESFVNIMSGGNRDLEQVIDASMAKRKFYNKRNKTKHYYAKDSKALGELYEMFGGGREMVVDAVLDYARSISKDIAIMEKLGPNPDAGFLRLEGHLKMAKSKDFDISTLGQVSDLFTGKGVTNLTIQFNRAEYVTLKNSDFAAEQNVALSALVNARSWAARASLGGMFYSVLGDFVYMGSAFRTYGRGYGNAIRSFLTELSLNTYPFMLFRGQSKDYIRATGQTIDIFNSLYDVQAREHALMNNSAATRLMNFLTFRMTGSAAATKSTRTGTALDMGKTLAFESEKAWGEIDPKLRELLSETGMNEALWEGAVRKNAKRFKSIYSWRKGLYDHSALRADDSIPIELRYPAARAIDEAIVLVSHMASNEGNLATETLTSGRAAPVFKEIVAPLFQLKSFTISQMNWHLNPMVRRIFNEEKLGQKAWGAYEFALFGLIATTAGTLANQLSDIGSGLTPEPLFDKDGSPNGDAFIRGMARSGALGLYGDYINATVNGDRYGKNGSSAIFDFLLKDGSDAASNLVSTSVEALFGDDRKKRDKAFIKMQKEALRATYRFAVPKPWFARPIMDIYLKKALQSIDPKERKMQKTRDKRLKKEWGQERWITPPGQDNRPEKIIEAWEKDYERFQKRWGR